MIVQCSALVTIQVPRKYVWLRFDRHHSTSWLHLRHDRHSTAIWPSYDHHTTHERRLTCSFAVTRRRIGRRMVEVQSNCGPVAVVIRKSNGVTTIDVLGVLSRSNHTCNHPRHLKTRQNIDLLEMCSDSTNHQKVPILQFLEILSKMYRFICNIVLNCTISEL